MSLLRAVMRRFTGNSTWVTGALVRRSVLPVIVALGAVAAMTGGADWRSRLALAGCGVLAGVIVGAHGVARDRADERTRRGDAGVMVLAHPWTTLALAAGFLAIVVMSAVTIESQEPLAGAAPDERAVLLLGEGSVLLLMIGIGVYAVLEAAFTRLEVDGSGIRSWSPWRRPRFIRWMEITEVTSGGWRKRVLVKALDGTQIAIPLSLGGVEGLVSRLSRETTATATDWSDGTRPPRPPP